MSVFFAVLLLGGCAEYALNTSDELAAPAEGDETAELDFSDVQLRLDVLPALTSTSTPLLAQSFWLEEQDDWLALTASLQPTVTISGEVLGFAANPYGIEPTVPGQSDVPVIGQVQLQQLDTIVESSIQTDEAGQFLLELPAGTGYRLAILPTDPIELPIAIEDGLTFNADTDLGSIELDYGDPVYGTVTNSSGDPVDCLVRLIDASTNISGPTIETDEDGFYMLRAEPGSYLVQIEPGTGMVLPTVQNAVSFEPEVGGVNLDIDIGTINPVLVSGIPRTPDGHPLSSAIVRFTSHGLAEAAGTMTVETNTDQSGIFRAYILPGDWTIEIIPPVEESSVASPLELSQTFAAGSDVNLGSLALPERVEVRRLVVDTWGSPAANVQVTFQEQGFDNAYYNVYTDQNGLLEVTLPDVALDVVLTPTQDNESAITHRELLNPSVSPDASDEDEVVETWSLSSGRLLSGIVSRPDGEEGISVVEVRDADGTLYGSTITDTQGSFTLRITP